MASFTDTEGRTWAVMLNVTAIKRVRALVKYEDEDGVLRPVDLTKVFDLGSGMLERLEDAVLLVDTLYVVCMEQADAKGVTDEDFGRALSGDSLAAAGRALFDALVDFAPSRSRRVLRPLGEKAERVQSLSLEQMEAALADPAMDRAILEAAVRRFGGPSTDVPASSGSTPDR